MDWRSVIEQEWHARHDRRDADVLFPLIAQSFDHKEIIAAVDVLLTGQITMGEQVRAFERAFAEAVGAPFAVMVNSGSSANLLALAAAGNPQRQQHLCPGDEVLVPAVCWPTSVWPLLGMGLRPVFVDADPVTLNVDLEDLHRKAGPRTRGLVAVHILGNSAPMADVMALVRRHDWILVEDTCESLGSRACGRTLGTFGAFGAYSFYYSHHITTGEGGMVVCHRVEDLDLLRCLRAHGWSRDLSNRSEVEACHPHVDPRFLFVNQGFNLRPLEVQAAFGLCQLQRLETMNANRVANRERLVATLRSHPRWTGQLQFPVAAAGTDPVWFGFPCLLAPALAPHRQDYLAYLAASGVETRPIVSGNVTRQPALARVGIAQDPQTFPGAEQINDRGFFIGIHTDPLPDVMVGRVADVLLGYCP